MVWSATFPHHRPLCRHALLEALGVGYFIQHVSLAHPAISLCQGTAGASPLLSLLSQLCAWREHEVMGVQLTLREHHTNCFNSVRSRRSSTACWHVAGALPFGGRLALGLSICSGRLRFPIIDPRAAMTCWRLWEWATPGRISCYSLANPAILHCQAAQGFRPRGCV